MNFRKSLLALTVAATLAPLSAQATNGYFSIGYGAKARGLAGATTAFPQDAMAAATNPAGIAHVGHRADVNVNIFSPVREASVFPIGSEESEMNGFIIPSGGYVRPVNDKLTVGITAYANGGMNTFYDTPNTAPNLLFGPGTNLGVDLAQLIFAPTIAYKVNDTHTLGASLLVGYQQFKAYGLQAFAGFRDPLAPPPADPEAGLTDQGYDDAWGVGVRVGWQGNISEKLTLGAAYSSKIYMDEFDDYDFLFAEQGDFDIPANWSVGLAYKVTPKSTATFDIQHIQYSDVKAIANTGPALTGAPFDVVNRGGLGADNGLGFGWNDMTIFKLGWLYEHNDKFTYRFGVSHGDQPIDDDEVLFNVLAPAVIETHLTAGFSYRPSGKDDQEFTFTYMHGVHNKVKGDPLPSFGGIVPEIEMYQHAFEFEYSWKF